MNLDNVLRKGSNRLASAFFSHALDQSQYWGRERMHALRSAKLKRVLRIAVDTVPAYRHLDRVIDFENFSLDELRHFPIVTKLEIRANESMYRSGAWRTRFAHKYRTSGSSGNRFTFLLPFWSGAIEEATAYRAWGMGGTYVYRRGDPVVFLRTYAPKAGEPLFRRDTIHNYWYLSPFDLNDKNLSLYIDVITLSETRMIRAYPSSLYLFTILLRERNIRLPKIASLVTASETLIPKYRSVIEEYWGLPVLDWYGQNERTVTIQQCWAGTYHNNDEYGLVEMDTSGQIVATSLNNDVMPFIRYATGDYAEARNDDTALCSCGRTLSSPLSAVHGRADDMLCKADGTFVPTINIYTAMEKFDAVRQFSILQTEDKNLHMKISLQAPVTQEQLQQMKTAILQRVGTLPIDLRVVEEMERDAVTEKQRAIRSLVRIPM
jgi:phenylacetate-CoA ligase